MIGSHLVLGQGTSCCGPQDGPGPSTLMSGGLRSGPGLFAIDYVSIEVAASPCNLALTSLAPPIKKRSLARMDAPEY